MMKELQKNILDGEFELGIKLYQGVPYEQLEHDIMIIGYDTGNISVYLFILDMIFKKESAELHSIACGLLENVFTYVSGAYYMAYNHMVKATKLEPAKYEYLENLLFFYHIPEKILNREEALEIANQVLKMFPDSKAAQSIINE